MKEQIIKKPSNSTAIIVRVDLSKELNPEELASFKQQAEKEGRTVREHFLAITLGQKTSAA